MRWLKALVIGMGVAIVVGLTVVIVELVRRAGEPSPSAADTRTGPAPPVIGAPPQASRSTAAPLRMIGDIKIDIPAGAEVEDVVLEPKRLIVRLRLADGRPALLLIEAATGRKLGLITLDNRQGGR